MLLSRLRLVAGLIVVFLVLSIGLIQAAESAKPADLTSPSKTYGGFLRALKSNHLAAAKSFWVISDDNKSGVLDIIVGYWITERRLNSAIRSRLSAADLEALRRNGTYSTHCTVEAIDRTIDRLKHSETEIRGDKAKLWVNWQDADGRDEQPVFHWSGGFPLASFREVGGVWRIDANKEIAFRRPADYLEPVGWYYQGPSCLDHDQQLLKAIENGKLRSAEEVKKESDRMWRAVEVKAETDRRTGKLSLADARFFAAHKIWQRWKLETMCGRGSTWNLNRWSRRLLEAEQGLGRKKADNIGAAEDHLDRVGDVRDLAQNHVAYGRYSASSYMGADHDVAEAQIQLAKAHNAGPGDRVLNRARIQRAAAAAMIDEDWQNEFRSAEERRRIQMSLVTGATWARLNLEACQELGADETDQANCAEMYLSRMDKIAKFADELRKSKMLAPVDDAALRFFHADAERVVAADKKRDDGQNTALVNAQNKRLEAAKAAYTTYWSQFQNGFGYIETIYQRSLHWQNAALAMEPTSTGRLRILEAHIGRMKDIAKLTREREKAGRVATWEKWATEYFVAEAEIRLSEAKSK